MEGLPDLHYYAGSVSWIIQLDLEAAVDPARPDRRFNVWARIKFTGPAFPHGRPEDPNAIWVERTFPLHTPSIAKIEVSRRGSVRRAKLYYIRNLRGKAARIKERDRAR